MTCSLPIQRSATVEDDRSTSSPPLRAESGDGKNREAGEAEAASLDRRPSLDGLSPRTERPIEADAKPLSRSTRGLDLGARGRLHRTPDRKHSVELPLIDATIQSPWAILVFGLILCGIALAAS